MKHFLVTFRPTDDSGTEDRLAVILGGSYMLLTRDVSAGLFIIGSDEEDETATTVLEAVLDLLADDESVFTLYVFELAGTWDGASDPTVIKQIGHHLPRD